MARNLTKLLGLSLLVVASTARATEGLPYLLATGWPTVLDLEDVRDVRVADPSLASVVRLDERQVLLIGGTPGQTTLTITAGSADAPVTVVHGLTVIRGQSFFGDAEWVRARVATPRRLHVPRLARVVAGDAAACEVRQVGPDELELLPRQPGVTMVVVWSGGSSSANRRAVLVDVAAGEVSRSADDELDVDTDPVDGRLSLISGESALCAVGGVTRVAVADASVVRVRPAGAGEVLVEGLAAGATRVTLWTGESRRETRFVVVHEHTEAPPPVVDPLPMPVPKDRSRRR
jgi:Flp pilus assembly secretin CpaC